MNLIITLFLLKNHPKAFWWEQYWDDPGHCSPKGQGRKKPFWLGVGEEVEWGSTCFIYLLDDFLSLRISQEQLVIFVEELSGSKACAKDATDWCTKFLKEDCRKRMWGNLNDTLLSGPDYLWSVRLAGSKRQGKRMLWESLGRWLWREVVKLDYYFAREAQHCIFCSTHGVC